MGPNIMTKLAVVLSLLQIGAVVLAAENLTHRHGVSSEAVEEFCNSAASSTANEHVDACINHHLSLSQLNQAAGGKDPHDFIIDGLKTARSEIIAAGNFIDKELAPRTNREKQPLVFHLALEGCRDAFAAALGHMDRAAEFFGKPEALSSHGPMAQLLQGLADVSVLTGGCVDAMAETNDKKAEKAVDEKLAVVQEKTSATDAMITTLTLSPERLLLAH